MAFLGIGRRSDEARFGHYHVLSIVHSGEKSLVLAAQPLDPTAGARVAIKQYTKPYERLSARLEKKYGLPSEARVGMMLNPPEGVSPERHLIVRTIDSGREYGRRRGARYIVQEFVRGRSLKRLISCTDPIVRTHVGAIVLQLCRALRVCHKTGLVFRDVCSDNVLVTHEGRVKLIDLGFVAPLGMAFEERGGTPSYMSPEQVLARPLGLGSDMYSLGVVFYEMLTGHLPYRSDVQGEDERSQERRRTEIMLQHVEQPVPELPEEAVRRAPALAAAATRCLQKEPEDRFRTMDELMAALLGRDVPELSEESGDAPA